MKSPRTRHSMPGCSSRRSCVSSNTLEARPLNAAPTSSNQSHTSTATASLVADRTSATSIDSGRASPNRAASSGRPVQPPDRASSITAACRVRCSASRGRSAPGTRSRNAASCPPTTDVATAHVASVAPWPSPRSSSLHLGCEMPARVAASTWRSPTTCRDSRRATPIRVATACARRRPVIAAGLARRFALGAPISAASLGTRLSGPHRPIPDERNGCQARRERRPSPGAIDLWHHFAPLMASPIPGSQGTAGAASLPGRADIGLTRDCRSLFAAGSRRYRARKGLPEPLRCRVALGCRRPHRVAPASESERRPGGAPFTACVETEARRSYSAGISAWMASRLMPWARRTTRATT
jgi:hypothetical protein